MSAYPKERRLLTKSDYSHVFSNAKRFKQSSFMLCAASNSQNNARLGTIVAKRHANKAVARNRIKRIVRESFRMQDLPNIDIVFVAYTGVDTLSNQELRERLNKLWKRLETWPNK